MSPVDPLFETQFLVNLQRLLTEGAFVATYKYALLLSLADISVEIGDDTADTLTINTSQIGEKFISYYWRQIVPYPGLHREPVTLAQNTGKQAAVIRNIEQTFVAFAGSYTDAKHSSSWGKLIGDIALVVEKMPLWRLQTVGAETREFLYENVGRGNTITLKAGVMFCFRKYRPLISELVKGGWASHVRRTNADLLGHASDLHEFLFGSERASLKNIISILAPKQNDCCFYCEKTMRAESICVDHFIPWSRYSIDLGHNFVLAHGSCNGAKSDFLAAEEHLNRWVRFLRENGDSLTTGFENNGLSASPSTSLKITRWAYHQTFASSGSTWAHGKEMKPLSTNWEDCFIGG